MTKRVRIEQVVQGAQTGLAVLLLLTVAMAGLFVAGTSWIALTSPEPLATGYECDIPPSSDDPQQSMTPNGRPLPASSTSQILPLIIKTDNSDKRLVLDDQPSLKSCRRVTVTIASRPLLTSAFAVDPRVGRQFTLVGAKPSGLG